jgi:hypothetical protein
VEEFANPLRRHTPMNSISNSCRSIPVGKANRETFFRTINNNACDESVVSEVSSCSRFSIYKKGFLGSFEAGGGLLLRLVIYIRVIIIIQQTIVK